MSSYTYLRVVTERVHRLSYGGMGATEFRLLVAAWALVAAWLGPGVTATQAYGFAVLEVVIGGLSAATFLGFVVVIQKDLAHAARRSNRASRPKRRNIYPSSPAMLDGLPASPNSTIPCPRAATHDLNPSPGNSGAALRSSGYNCVIGRSLPMPLRLHSPRALPELHDVNSYTF